MKVMTHKKLEEIKIKKPELFEQVVSGDISGVKNLINFSNVDRSLLSTYLQKLAKEKFGKFLEYVRIGKEKGYSDIELINNWLINANDKTGEIR